MIKYMKKILLIIGFSLGLFSFAMAKTVSIETAVGTVKVAEGAKKVVVLDVGVIDNINQLGAGDKVGMVPQFKYLKNINFDTKNKQEAGTLFEPNFEAIARYKPDLIIVATRSAKQLKPLSEIAPTIDLTIKNDHYMENVAKQLTALGLIFNKKSQAEQLINQLNQKINTAKDIVKKKNNNALFILVNGNKLSTSGENSRFGWLYKYLGIRPAADGITTDPHGQPVSFEFIKQHNPDWLLVFDRFAAIGKEGPDAQKILDNAIIHDTNAWKNKHIIYLDSSIYLQVGGLTGLHKNIDLVIEAFKNHQ